MIAHNYRLVILYNVIHEDNWSSDSEPDESMRSHAPQIKREPAVPNPRGIYVYSIANHDHMYVYS